jgi:hypothetical protein
MPAAWSAALPQTFLAEQPLARLPPRRAPACWAWARKRLAKAAMRSLRVAGGQHVLGPAEVRVEDAAGERRRVPNGSSPGVGLENPAQAGYLYGY